MLRAEQAIPALVGLIANQDPDNHNDWIVEEMPTVLAMIGPAATFELTALVEREDASQDAREDAGSVLTGIALEHPDERPGVVATLTRWLERAEWHNPTSNGFFVNDLIMLEARESAEVIERAYAGEFVDESINGTWYDVWHYLKMEGTPPPWPENAYFDSISPYLDATLLDEDLLDEFPPLPPSHPGWQPVESKTPEERKDRNKARQKLEKKVKGKAKDGKRR